jgi:surface polysaccharide O-acyltransferase-like enzyme
MDEITAKSERNLGLDALKLFSMFLIALLHVLGQGGVLGACPFGSARGEAAWFWETLGYCSVDCFALATGYIMAGRQVHYKRLFGLWLTVVFWMLAATAVFALAQPGTVGLNDWLVCLFPAVTKQYWYFTCYFGLFFFMPFLNKLLANLTQAGCKRLFWTLAALLSLLPCLLVFRVFLPALPHPDVFVANGGYSLLWLAALYLLGGC